MALALNWNWGDTLDIILDYTIDGVPIEDADLDEMEFSIGPKRYTLAGEDFTIDPVTGKYRLFISQTDSFALGKAPIPYQFRCRKGENVGSTDKEYMYPGETISQEVI